MVEAEKIPYSLPNACYHQSFPAFSEDVGLANPNALLIANACFDAVMKVGLARRTHPSGGSHRLPRHKPEEQLRLHGHQQCPGTCTPDRQSARTPAPAHAPTKLMKQLGYGDNYKYAHDYPGHFVKQQFCPGKLKDRRLWEAQDDVANRTLRKRIRALWFEDKIQKIVISNLFLNLRTHFKYIQNREL